MKLITCIIVQAMKLKDFAPWKKTYDKSKQCIKKQRHYIANKGPYGQSYDFSHSCVWMWKLDHKESQTLKNWCFWIMVLEKTLESPLDCKEIKPVNPKEHQSWILIGRTDTGAPTLWPPDVKSQLIRKDPDVGKGWGKEKGMTGDNGWMSSLTQWTWVWANSRGLEWRTGKPAVLSTWRGKESDMTEQLNNNNNKLLSKSLRENVHRAHFWDY